MALRLPEAPFQERMWDQCRVCWELGFVKGYVCIKVGRAETHILEMKITDETNEISCRERKEGCVLAPRACPAVQHCCHITSGLTQGGADARSCTWDGNSWLCAL